MTQPPPTQINYNPYDRVLKRPKFGGWNARTWRREVCEWLALAALVVASWAFLNLLVGAVDLVAH